MTAVRAILSRYDRRSALALGVLFALYVSVAVNWWELIDFSRGMDWLLAGIWAFMTALLVWDVDPKKDVPLAVVGFFGGLVIEWWGTTTNLWHYYTAERPPIWILPAWPVAALAIDRIARVLDHVVPPLRSRVPFWLLAGGFTVAMTRFTEPSWGILSTQVVTGLMLVVTATVREPRRETIIFIGGALLGVFLEYWGTSRWCWTYYTKEIPPWEAVVAHGFASVAFTRGTQLWAAWAARRTSDAAPAVLGAGPR
jgi:hypothetical protein